MLEPKKFCFLNTITTYINKSEKTLLHWPIVSCGMPNSWGANILKALASSLVFNRNLCQIPPSSGWAQGQVT